MENKNEIEEKKITFSDKEQKWIKEQTEIREQLLRRALERKFVAEAIEKATEKAIENARSDRKELTPQQGRKKAIAEMKEQNLIPGIITENKNEIDRQVSVREQEINLWINADGLTKSEILDRHEQITYAMKYTISDVLSDEEIGPIITEKQIKTTTIKETQKQIEKNQLATRPTNGSKLLRPLWWSTYVTWDERRKFTYTDPETKEVIETDLVLKETQYGLRSYFPFINRKLPSLNPIPLLTSLNIIVLLGIIPGLLLFPLIVLLLPIILIISRNSNSALISALRTLALESLRPFYWIYGKLSWFINLFRGESEQYTAWKEMYFVKEPIENGVEYSYTKDGYGYHPKMSKEKDEDGNLLPLSRVDDLVNEETEDHLGGGIFSGIYDNNKSLSPELFRIIHDENNNNIIAMRKTLSERFFGKHSQDSDYFAPFFAFLVKHKLLHDPKEKNVPTDEEIVENTQNITEYPERFSMLYQCYVGSPVWYCKKQLPFFLKDLELQSNIDAANGLREIVDQLFSRAALLQMLNARVQILNEAAKKVNRERQRDAIKMSDEEAKGWLDKLKNAANSDPALEKVCENLVAAVKDASILEDDDGNYIPVEPVHLNKDGGANKYEVYRDSLETKYPYASVKEVIKNLFDKTYNSSCGEEFEERYSHAMRILAEYNREKMKAVEDEWEKEYYTNLYEGKELEKKLALIAKRTPAKKTLEYETFASQMDYAIAKGELLETLKDSPHKDSGETLIQLVDNSVASYSGSAQNQKRIQMVAFFNATKSYLSNTGAMQYNEIRDQQIWNAKKNFAVLCTLTVLSGFTVFVGVGLILFPVMLMMLLLRSKAEEKLATAMTSFGKSLNSNEEGKIEDKKEEEKKMIKEEEGNNQENLIKEVAESGLKEKDELSRGVLAGLYNFFPSGMQVLSWLTCGGVDVAKDDSTKMRNGGSSTN